MNIMNSIQKILNILILNPPLDSLVSPLAIGSFILNGIFVVQSGNNSTTTTWTDSSFEKNLDALLKDPIQTKVNNRQKRPYLYY